MKYPALLLTCFFLCSLKSQGQDTIQLENPSFEETPDWYDKQPGWKSCDAAQAAPPTVQPGYFKVDQPASDGETYLALVVRDDSTSEVVSQQLPVPLQEGLIYHLHIDLMRSPMYLLQATAKTEMVNYATPVKLRVWGGHTSCEKQELLYTTPLITTTRWLTYDLALTPQQGDYDYLILEACHKTPVLFPYNGNLLIDNVILSLSDR